MNTKYQPVIGLEIHVELNTKSKMFCRCPADYFGQEPNTHTCPVCLGLPGALPVPNKQAIEDCIKIGLALNCQIPLESKFDRKNYFYPDLPKGYQISQYDEPFAINGSINIETEEGTKRIGIRRVHMEEDTGKLTHSNIDGKSASLIDFNRSGVPLVEIVTEPDFTSYYAAQEVVIFLKKIQQIVRYLGVSNADLEKGDMRMEPNISMRKPEYKELPKYKVEVKNINSFRFVLRAISKERIRQEKLLNEGETPAQETRGWNEKLDDTVSQRSKEEAHDYRYFPEPDIPPFRFAESQISNLKSQIPELPDAKINRLVEQFALSEYDAEILTREIELASYFEEAVKVGKDHNISPKQIANHIINKKPDLVNTVPADLVKIIYQATQTISIDTKEIEKIVKTVLNENPQAVADYKSGKVQVIGFLIGKARQKLPTQIDNNQVKSALVALLK